MKPEKLQHDYRADVDALSAIHQGLDEKENFIVSRLDSNSLAANFKSRVTDGRLTTITWERAMRVVSQMGTGQVKALTQQNKGKGLFMDILLQRYVLPNADWGQDMLTKLRMWDFYSLVYGVMPMLYDWRVCDDYVGPDCRLIPIRNFTPQRGRTSINDCDYVFIDSYHTAAELESELEYKESQWNTTELRKIIKEAKEAGGNDQAEEHISAVEQSRRTAAASANLIRLVTKYEKGKNGKWVTFAPDYGFATVRNISNPHKNGKIPVVLKHAFPLIDSIWGLGDFERGKTLQMAMDSLVNLYLDGVKMSVFPPVIINPNGVVPSTIKYAPGTKWLESLPNSIRRYESSPQGLQTFQSTYSFLTGALQNQAGTSDTTINSENSSDPSFGKTPEALKMLQARESARDNWDRFMMEQAIENLYGGFVSMLATRQEHTIPVHIFDQEIEQILATGVEDLQDFLTIFESGDVAELKITKDAMRNKGAHVNYKFYIDAGSTKKKDDEQEHEILGEIIGSVGKTPGLMEMLAQQGWTLDMGEAYAAWVRSSGTDNADKIIRRATQEEINAPQQQAQQAEQQAQEQAMMQQAQANTPPAPPNLVTASPGPESPVMVHDQQLEGEFGQIAQQLFGGK